MPNEMLPMSTWKPKDGQTYEIVDKDARDRITDLEEHAGSGTVKSVNNVQPDASGNVSLSAGNIPGIPDGLGLSDGVKQALLNCFQHVAWVDDQGQTYYQALYNALYSSSQDVDRITATFAQGGATIMTTDSLNDLRQYLTVKAYYSGGVSETVTAYTLTGTLTAGTSTITATYGGKSATFNVNVTAPSADVQRDGNTLYIINASVTRDGSTLVFS